MHIMTHKEYNREVDNLKWAVIAFAKEHSISVEDAFGHPDFPAIIDKVVEKYFPNDLRKQEEESLKIGNMLERDAKFW